jgi:hypothetical protein
MKRTCATNQQDPIQLQNSGANNGACVPRQPTIGIQQSASKHLLGLCSQTLRICGKIFTIDWGFGMMAQDSVLIDL